MFDNPNLVVACVVGDGEAETGPLATALKQQLKDKLIEHKQSIGKHGQDMPEIGNWKWSNPK